ncbi:hypothetical protein [Pseudoalteromonas tunicata]|uniref:Uncharacterized protein n=1 Tax=Pseudoalteromonas tunicata D2 TaxID=87626 RepID=A4C5T2_9GAMM|nr:hypothetical protein [Pseudoalteromonas tunicata]ATC95312.1 hypothetical protein PTUN_a2907 [Pseudoalteromonas tunicata]AXT30910.1 hypothetical protein D1819_08960 [Pseudoalteromonas tunicata]EAR29336.1 hypothetical protein PTD2_10989 [Pseudoalteromonas tunicata D2]
MSKVLNSLWNVGAALFWGLLLILLPLYLLLNNSNDWCGSEQYEIFISPNQDIEAVVTIINCGATTNYETQISVNRVDSPADKNVLVVLDGHPNELEYKVSWLGENTIEVSEFNFKDLLSFHSRNKTGDIVRSHIKPKAS